MSADPKLEYQGVTTAIRHNGDRRDARMTLYLAVSGGLVVLAFGQAVVTQFALPVEVRRLLADGGAIITLVYTFIEWRLWVERQQLIARAKELETLADLNFTHYRRYGRIQKIPASLFLYGVFLTFWTATVSWPFR